MVYCHPFTPKLKSKLVESEIAIKYQAVMQIHPNHMEVAQKIKSNVEKGKDKDKEQHYTKNIWSSWIANIKVSMIDSRMDSEKRT